MPAPKLPEISPDRLKLSELISAFSYALDITEGQPEGHCVRCCYIGMHIAEELGFSAAQKWELYYVLLLKDLGCSSNAARICQLYLTDDLSFKRDFKDIDTGLSDVLGFVMAHTGLKADLAERFRAVVNIFRNGGEISRELIETRCTRGADIARQLRFPEPVAIGIRDLDEHWDGRGQPQGLRRQAISPYARIALLCQCVDVFFKSRGKEAALREILNRAGTWFEPETADAFFEVASRNGFWEGLCAPDLVQCIQSMEPAHQEVALDEDYLDDIAIAFGQVVDSKSPYTAGHSSRVALYTDMMAEVMGLDAGARRWLKRAALLHDVGKLGVSNTILDKPGRLDGEEWAQMQAHALYTETILSRIGAFSELARIAGAHHERLDGKGYPHGLSAEEISLETRIISTADFFDALTADRPYRPALPIWKALEIIGQSVGDAIDPTCFEALKQAIDRIETDAKAGTVSFDATERPVQKVA
ncbi:HD-GYP domain-containing protein [Asticcacaulis excentricus]|uniref:Metal dependent phosphohydrolase n=1 Tax=Asticcacaulis excentricus (strain ATCC 15261 / DSM 4724 / KCTC 12464 / NCIMB 9791 / VKM B-1370 / CB 48) TaxID=573065 RepID=E8RPE2_ASTEC|nr:HD-GYP domain-containing protein [Asticcacaulis excentricus]ADU11988.1 metal dependent phosphohydrolase [Asticcacaulis excentricus CB 48]